MKRLTAGWIALAPFAAWGGINDGIGGVKVGLGKTPPGKIEAYAVSDPAGSLRLPVPAAGRYVVEIAQPAPFPFWVNLNGEVRAAPGAATGGRPIAAGRMFPEGGPAGARLAIPGVPFDRRNGVFREEVEFSAAAELVVRVTEGPPLAGVAGQKAPVQPAQSTGLDMALLPLLGRANGGPPSVPVVTYRPPRPLPLAPGNYAAVSRRTGQTTTVFSWNPDGSISAPMIPKAGGGDTSGGGSCTVCTPGMPNCFEYRELPSDDHYFQLIDSPDAPFKPRTPPTSQPGSSGSGGTAPSAPKGSTSCTEGAKIAVRWVGTARATIVAPQ